jgi:hypothetical protein
MLQQPIATLLPADQYAQWREEVNGEAKVQIDALSPCRVRRDVLLTLSPLRGPHDTRAGLSIILKM